MLDITKDPDYANAYSQLPSELPGDSEMADEKKFFMSHVDSLSMQLTFTQNSIMQHENLFVIDSDWLVSSVVRLTDPKLEANAYERLNARLQLHELMLSENIALKPEIRRQLYLLKLTSFLVPFLIAMRKRMKIPDLQKMLPNMTGMYNISHTRNKRQMTVIFFIYVQQYLINFWQFY